MKVLKRTNRFYDTSRFGQPQIRVYHKKGIGRRMPRYLLKCGCCEEKVEIYYADDGLEISQLPLAKASDLQETEQDVHPKDYSAARGSPLSPASGPD